MTTHLGLQRIMIPGAQASALTTGSISLAGARDSTILTIPNGYSALSAVTITSTTTAVTFSNIPPTAKNLEIRYIARSATAGTTMGDMPIVFNGDSSALYQSHGFTGSNSTVYLAGAVGDTKALAFKAVAQASVTASHFAHGVINILDYASTSKKKVARYVVGGRADNSASCFGGFMYSSTNPITSITLSNDAGFTQYSHFALYGVK